MRQAQIFTVEQRGRKFGEILMAQLPQLSLALAPAAQSPVLVNY